MWDYEGKLESRGWSREQCLQILQARLLSPPGKMLRHFVQAVCDAILLESHSTAVHPPESDPRTSTKGFTSDIPFSPLKAKVTTRVTAAQTDFAEVDLTGPPLWRQRWRPTHESYFGGLQFDGGQFTSRGMQ